MSERSELLERLRSYVQGLWDLQDDFPFSSDEVAFAEVDPPNLFELESAAELRSESFIWALEAVPARWRIDTAMALEMLVEIDLDDEFTGSVQ